MKKKLAVFSAIALCILSFTGCTKKFVASTEATNLVLIYGNHANANPPDLSIVEEELMEVALSYGSVTVIENDGAPYIAVQETAEKPSANISESNKQRRARSFVAKVETLVEGNAVPLTEEVNTLESVELGVRSMSEKEGKKIMILADSGLSTTGALDLTQDYLDFLNVEETISTLSKEQAVPDVSNMDEIITYSLGDVAAPQDSLSNEARGNLISLWDGIFTEGGRIPDCKDTICVQKSAQTSNLPSVSKVETKKTLVDLPYEEADSPSETAAEPILSDVDVVEIPESQVAFVRDTADFSNQKDAEAALQPLAALLCKEKTECILIGMTATHGDAESSRTLSKERAEAVSQVLQSSGVSEDQIHCIGTGYDRTDFFTEDLNPDGTLNETFAINNRCVLLVGAKNKAAQKLLERYS